MRSSCRSHMRACKVFGLGLGVSGLRASKKEYIYNYIYMCNMYIYIIYL